MNKLVLGVYILITIFLFAGLTATYRNRLVAEKSAHELLVQVIDKPELEINGLQFNHNQINTKKGAILTITNKDLVGYDAIISETKYEFRLDANSNDKVIFDQTGLYTLQLRSFPYVQATIIVE